jgi:thiamine-phosphate pyrophosphorylase
MLAGEAGADYVLFGEPEPDGARTPADVTLERVEWWAQVFQVPCIGVAEAPDEVAPVARAGAEFVALGDWVFAAPADIAQIVADAAAALRQLELAP